MDLAFTPEEQKFRQDIRGWVRENLPKEISDKVHNALRLSRLQVQLPFEIPRSTITSLLLVPAMRCWVPRIWRQT